MTIADVFECNWKSLRKPGLVNFFFQPTCATVSGTTLWYLFSIISQLIQ